MTSGLISGPTNVVSLRMGRAVLRGLSDELGRFVVATMDRPWRGAGPLLEREPEAVVFVESMEEEVLEHQLSGLPPHDTVVGVGGSGVHSSTARSWAWASP